MKKIVIIGAGPAGLGAAYGLEESGHNNFLILEKNTYPGGLSASFKTKKGFIFDFGGHVTFSNSAYFNEVYDKSLKGEFLTHNRGAWVYIDGKYVAYPFQNNIFQLTQKQAEECLAGVKDARAEKRKRPKNFKDWIYRAFGKGIAKYFLIPYNEKIWAHPLNLMGFNWIGERVTTVDYDDLLARYEKKTVDASWGPNNYFKFSRFGGTGRFFEVLARRISADKIKYGCSVKSIDLKKKIVYFKKGKSVRYDFLINTIPLNEFLKKSLNLDKKIKKLSGEFLYNSVISIGIGIKGAAPSGKTWIYFPEKNIPFYRLSYISNYSPHLVPKRGYFSVLCEVSYSKRKKINVEKKVSDTISSVFKRGLAGRAAKSDIADIWHKTEKYAYPVPFLKRDKVLNKIVPYLKERAVYTVGRLGLWKYETGNMDHSFMQGVEAAREILEKATTENTEKQL